MAEVFKYLQNLRFTHFATMILNENNISNSEELFDINSKPQNATRQIKDEAERELQQII